MKTRRTTLHPAGAIVAGAALAIAPLTGAHAVTATAPVGTNSGKAAVQAASPPTFPASTDDDGFIWYDQPADGVYIPNTCLLDLSAFAEFETVSSVDLCGQTVTFTPGLMKETVPDSWSTWNSPPAVERSAPSVLVSDATSFTLSLSSPVTYAGMEAEPDPLEVHPISASYLAAGEPVGTITRDIDGNAGALMLGASSSTPFDSIMVSSDVDFAVAEIRIGVTGEDNSLTFGGYSVDKEDARAIHAVVTDPEISDCSVDNAHNQWLTQLGVYQTVVEDVCRSGHIEHTVSAINAGRAYPLELTVKPGDRIASTITAKGAKSILIKVTNLASGATASMKMTAGRPTSPAVVGVSTLDPARLAQPLGTFDPVGFSKVTLDRRPFGQFKPARQVLVDDDGTALLKITAIKALSFTIQYGSSCKAGVANCEPSCHVNQQLTNYGVGIQSENWSTSHPDSWDNQAADDFYVSVPCAIRTVSVTGRYVGTYTGPANSETVQIIDGGYTLGIYGPDATNQTVVGTDNAGTFAITLTNAVVLQPGHVYWLSVVANQTTHDFTWQWDQGYRSGYVSLWRNPGGGLQPSCTTWHAVAACFPGTPYAPHGIFKLD